jgi:hypothetical protein
MRTKHGLVNIKSTSFSGYVSPINIPSRENSGLFPEISIARFLLKGCCTYGFDAIEGVQRFGFENKTRCSGKMKPIHLRSTITVVLVHCNIVICADTGGYQIQ